MGSSSVDSLPWSWKECTLLRVCEAYEFCLTFRAPRSEKSAERPSEGGFEGIEKVFAAVGLGGGAQPPPARRGMLSQDLFESPNAAQSRRSSAAIGQEGITPPPDALIHEKSMVEGEKSAPLKSLPYPFTSFGPRDSGEQQQIPFPPSPAVPEESAGGRDDDEEEVEVEGDIIVKVDDEGDEQEKEEEEEEEEEDMDPRSSEEPSSFSDRASNSLLSLGQPIPSRYPFAFYHPARGGSMSSTGSPPFAFSRATATPQSKSTSTRESHSTGNVETASSSPSGGSPTSAVSPSSSVPSPQDVHGMPMPPSYPVAPGGRQRLSTAPSPVSPTPAVSRPRGHVKRSRGISSCVRVLAQKSCMSLTAKTTAHPAQDSLRLMTHSRRGNARILLVCFLHHLLNRVPGHPYLAHATAAQLLSRESAALSVPALVHGIPVRALALEAVEVHDTIPMSQCPAHH